jgi:hypothetical protein
MTREIHQASLDERGIVNDVDDVTIETSAFSVFPNPARTMAIVKFANETRDDLNLELFNNLGKLVYTGKAFKGDVSHELPVSHLPDGIFLLRVSSPEGPAVTRKIVVIR